MKESQTGKSTGAIIGAIIIITLLIIGGILLSRQESAPDDMRVRNVESVTETNLVSVETMSEEESLSESTDPAEIQADLDIATSLDALDAEIEALEAELEASSN